jgi:hypothetical protein
MSVDILPSNRKSEVVTCSTADMWRYICLFGDPVQGTLVELINILISKGILTNQDINMLRLRGLIV